MRSVDNAVPKSTAYKTKWSCKVFEEWKQNWLVKSCALEPSSFITTKDFEEGVQTLEIVITDMSACSNNYWVSKFVQEVSNSSGEHCRSRSSYSITCSLKCQLSDVYGSAALTPSLLRGQQMCVTTHSRFSKLCLDPDVLQLAIRNRRNWCLKRFQGWLSHCRILDFSFYTIPLVW